MANFCSPSDLTDVFATLKVTDIVRLNNKEEYNEEDFTSCGFTHHDLFFTDCTVPPDDVSVVYIFIHVHTPKNMCVY